MKTRHKKKVSEEEVLIRVQPMHMSDDIWILIPPKYWQVKHLAEHIRQAIHETVTGTPLGKVEN